MGNNTIYQVSASIYELAWVARLPFAALEELTFTPSDESSSSKQKTGQSQIKLKATPGLLLDNLVRQQYGDGSWGSSAYSLGDRLVNTLAAITALAFNRQRWSELQSPFPEWYELSLQSGIDWLQRQNKTYNPQDDPADLVGIELLVSSLKQELVELGVELDITTLTALLEKKAQAKLAVFPMQLIFQPGSTLSHSIEFTGQLLKPESANYLDSISPNGSVGNSPSATAFVMNYAWQDLSEEKRSSMVKYFSESAGVSSDLKDTHRLGWPANYPVNFFLEIWYKYYHRKLQGENNQPAFERGATAVGTAELASRGFGGGSHFTVDADTTSTYIHLVAREMVRGRKFAQLASHLETLMSFYNEAKGYFLTYQYEMTPSITTNAHAWQALNALAEALYGVEYPASVNLELARIRQVRDRVALYIKDQATPQGFWCDKWHMSPVYATYHVLASGIFTNDENGEIWLERSVRWLLANQSKQDGGWSLVKSDSSDERSRSNPDETFHAMMLLHYIWRFVNENYAAGPNFILANGGLLQLYPRLLRAIQRGADYLELKLETQPAYSWPALWCDKTLYCPFGMIFELCKELLAQVGHLRGQNAGGFDYKEGLLTG